MKHRHQYLQELTKVDLNVHLAIEATKYKEDSIL